MSDTYDYPKGPYQCGFRDGRESVRPALNKALAALDRLATYHGNAGWKREFAETQAKEIRESLTS